MSLRTTFTASDVGELTALRRRAEDTSHLPAGLVPGWHHDLLDPRPVVDAFDMWLTDDAAIQVHHAVSAHGSHGVVWIYPRALTAPALDWSRQSLHDRPEPPTGVPTSPMESVRAEPGGWSYLCASILARELAELGHTGAYARWRKLEICCGPLEVGPDPNFWAGDPPADLRPLVIEDNNGVTVRFHAFRRDPLRVVLIEDWYREGDLEATMRQRLVGREPGGET